MQTGQPSLIALTPGGNAAMGPFGLLLDLFIYLDQGFGLFLDQLVGPVAHLDTSSILQHYDPEYAKKRVFKFYLVTLAEAWLRDLAYHWKSESPPGSEELQRVGLLSRMEGGTTVSIVE